MRVPAFLSLSSLLMAEAWAAPQQQHRVTNEHSSTGPTKEATRANEEVKLGGAVAGGITILTFGAFTWKSRNRTPPDKLSSLGRLGPPMVHTFRHPDPELERLASDYPRFRTHQILFEIEATTQKQKVVSRMVEDEDFLQCMLRRLDIALPVSHLEIPVRDLDLFRSAFLCQIKTGEFGFRYPHIKRYFENLADDPVGYREEDLKRAAEAMRFHVPAQVSQLYAGLRNDLRSLERPVRSVVLSMERAALKRMPTAAEMWQFTSEHP
ncbi:MAG: hypothetical protein M1826_004198 [Phylliscum demangeonii]|nr:MAG: hypothetical protein M1826_004198 [Phylliscum demangeonii]